ncbi:MAG: hypothetical protein IPK61_09750 [Saprospiraceae bacterium]|nr:hypothetical protein [Saprospiraceae bacterium]
MNNNNTKNNLITVDAFINALANFTVGAISLFDFGISPGTLTGFRASYIAAKGGAKFTQGAGDDLVVGLKNTHGSNVTVMKDGVDIFRVHQPGTHRSSVSTITKIREHMTPKGPMRIADSKSSSFDQSTFDMLRQAANSQGGYSLRTLGGR